MSFKRRMLDHYVSSSRTDLGRSTSSSSGSSATSISSSSATAAGTTSAISSAASLTPASSSDIGAATASSDSANNGVNGTQDRHHNNDLAIGLGVGLGIGLPLLAVLLVLCFCFRRRRKRSANSMPRGQHPTISRPMQQQSLRDSDQQPIIPPIPAPVVFPDHQSQTTHRHSGTTVNSVAESYHGPFEFEGQDGRDFDTKSVVSEYDQRSGRWGTPTGRRSASGSTRTATPSNHGRSRLRSIDEQMPPRMVTPPQWPLRS
ncbi:hypothetical protein LTR78_010894 [Recurvomyces mirabilis]|uniref:Mid2 domain-containing protein n=1 Tax=Recurvomyces mirabilis TaxID=574656 RepID=A0AAE0WHS1_9PEZI|nr:hypothetical protein LTR78_010894 [Recurvomyces mirabilis]KAK5151707.1 hypothetical protein LTS14_009194 [Recurvomyces mirabilis]